MIVCFQPEISKNSDPEKNIFFGVYNSLSVHTDNINKDVLVLDERSTDGLDDTAGKAEAKYSFNINKSRKKISLSLHYNTANSVLYANSLTIHQFKANDTETKPHPLRLRDIWKSFYSQKDEK